MDRTALVVASNRPNDLINFLRRWQSDRWHEVVVVEDAAGRSDPVARTLDQVAPRYSHYCHDDIDRLGPPTAALFSRGDAAIKGFGLYQALAVAHHNYAIVLDDDCLPVPGTTVDAFVAAHLEALDGPPRWVRSVRGLNPRGLPYFDHGNAGSHCLHMGLWRGCPDLDAVTTLAEVRRDDDPTLTMDRLLRFDPPSDCWLVHPRQYAPFSGMNFACTADALPLLYFPPMGRGSPYRRFDDIWAGIVFQRCAAALGWAWSIGPPHVWHHRAGSPFERLIGEAKGLQANEWFWQVVDAVGLDDRYQSPATCVEALAAGLINYDGTQGRDPEFLAYVRRYGQNLRRWIDLVVRGRETEAA